MKTTPYERALQLNEMGIPAITANLKAYWSEEKQIWVKDKVALAKSLPNSTFLGKGYNCSILTSAILLVPPISSCFTNKS